MDYEARRKEPSCISGVDSRADAKLEAKARKLDTTVKRKRCGRRVAWWK